MQLHGFIMPIKMAEEEGFEPSRQVLAHQHAFQACALNRSATPPDILQWRRGWDSNPRDGVKPPTRFRVGLLRPAQTPLPLYSVGVPALFKKDFQLGRRVIRQDPCHNLNLMVQPRVDR